MQIVCPHCSTSYGIDSATLGAAGRTVRCARCKELWHARPEDAVELVNHAMAGANQGDGGLDEAADWGLADQQDAAGGAPHIDSPSIASDWQDSADEQEPTDWSATDENDFRGEGGTGRFGWLGRLRGPMTGRSASRFRMPFGLTTACAAMGALALAIVVWRAELVRLMPQTAGFYKLVGLEVNLRGLKFKDVKVTSEMVEGKQVLVIEGSITGESNKPVEIPRLRFSVRDAQGAEIYAWNSVLEQSVLRPGERAQFKSRLASPPPEGRNIDVRFFNKRDLTGGHA